MGALDLHKKSKVWYPIFWVQCGLGSEDPGPDFGVQILNFWRLTTYNCVTYYIKDVQLYKYFSPVRKFEYFLKNDQINSQYAWLYPFTHVYLMIEVWK